MPPSSPMDVLDWSWILVCALRTLGVGGLGSSLAVAAAAILVGSAWLTWRALRHLLIATACAFLLVPTYAVAGAYSSSGEISGLFSISPVAAAQSPAWAIFATAWIHAVSKMPLCFLILIFGGRQISRQAFDMARLDGKLPHVVSRLLLPKLWPWLVAAWLLTFLLINADMVITNLYQVETLTEAAYLNLSLGRSSTALEITLVIVSIGLVMLALGIARKHLSLNLNSHSAANSLWSYSPRSLVQNLTSTCIGILTTVLFVVVPFGNLVYKSGIVVEQQDQTVQQEYRLERSLGAVLQAPSEFAEEATWTIKIGLWTLFGTLLFSLLLLGISRRTKQANWLLISLCLVCIALPGPLINRLAITLFNRPSEVSSFLYNDTLLPTVFCLLFRTGPICLLILHLTVVTLSQRYAYQWAMDASSYRSQLRLIGAVISRPVSVVCLICFAVSAGELNAYLLVLPPGVTPLSMRLFDLLHYAVRFRDAGLLVLMTMVGSLISVLICRRFVL